MSNKEQEEKELETQKQEIVEEQSKETTTEIQSEETISEEEKLKNDLAVINDKYIRLIAEFENFKRRTTKERIELLDTAGKDVIKSMLPIMDDLDRSLKVMETAQELAPVKEGVQLIHQKLKNILALRGLKEVESIGKTFDTDFHEAITNIPAPSEEMKDIVLDEVEKGYTLNDKVIRFAKVVVGN